MLVHEINVTDEDIAYAEKILLKEGQAFNDMNNERIDFIKDLTTLDLQAVPGSGKTTVLLAKLLILEKYLPFDDGSGVLVISHTNTAVNEIENRIGKYCPRLFSYPNFIGTIQSFVNKFLAIPYYKTIFRKGIIQIDRSSYDERFQKFSRTSFSGFSIDIQNKAKSFLRVEKNLEYRFKMEGEELKLLKKFNDRTYLEIKKPRGRTRPSNYVDWSNEEKESIEKWLVKYKLEIMKEGILHYDDVYFLANTYIQRKEQIKKILAKRFSIVFIDEMQDMGKHQYDLLENLFFENDSETIFQRIGDKNQAIYNSGIVETNLIWIARGKVLRLTGTNRFSQSIASFVQNFGIEPIQINALQVYTEELKPHIFIYKDDNICDVIPKYSTLVKSYVDEGKFIIEKDKPCKVVAWVKKEKGEEKITLPSFYGSFIENHHKVKENYENLKSYLLYFERANNSFKGVRKSIINAFLKILRLENIKDERDRFYTKTSLINTLKEKQKEEQNSIYDDFNLNIYKWCKRILIDNNIEESYNDIKNYIPIFLNIFDMLISSSRTFIDEQSIPTTTTTASGDINNIYNEDGIDIHISTVHSVKGETHTATLYLESFYYSEYESQRLLEQFKFIPFNKTATRHIQSAKMAYVGFSRPTHLLCIAIHEDRYDTSLSESGYFKIINI